MQQFCTDCGKPLASGARFCGNCGVMVAESSSAPSTFAAAPKDSEPPLTLQPSPKSSPTYKSYWYITIPIALLFLAWPKGREYLHMVDSLPVPVWLRWVVLAISRAL